MYVNFSIRSFIICTLAWNIIRMNENEMEGTYNMHGEIRNAYKILVRNMAGKRSFRHKWENIKIWREGRD
jgi:hypothetical protein